MKPPHKHFFSSLKQVEKRLKLDDGNPPQTTETPPTDSIISSPIYIQDHHTSTSSSHHNDSISQPPQEFLSYNNDTNTTPSNPNKIPNPLNDNISQTTAVDEVDSMIQLLGLSDLDGKGLEINDFCDDEFYDKIVKVKGPKCKKEVERLDGWINYFLNNDGLEPLRLAHLLLAKAAFVTVCSGSGDDRVEFPSTVDEFLRCDPPSVHNRFMDDGEVKPSDDFTSNSSNKHKDRSLVKPEKPSGNRVAVRKYREKKKAQNAYLEEEVKKLRVVNRGLIRKLEFQAALAAEAVRLKSLLFNLKLQINKEMSFDHCNHHD